MPFSSSLIPSDSDLRLFGRANIIRTFESWFSGPSIQSRLICGLKGTGKTTLLRSFFNDDFRKKMATESKVLIQLCSFNGNRMQTDADVFCRLTESVLESLRNLGTKSSEYLTYTEAFRKAKQDPDFSDYETNRDHGYNLLRNYLGILQEDGYRVVLVFDDFHHLTCSPNCATETFSNMAEIIQNNDFVSYIISTDYHIKVGSDAYRISPFERIFSMGSPMKIEGTTIGTKKKQLRFFKEYIHEQLKAFQEYDCEEDEMISFSDEDLDYVLNLTSGIPAMIQYTLNALYKQCLKNPVPLTKSIIRDIAFQNCASLMEAWTKHLSDRHWKILRIVLDGGDARECDKLPKNDNVCNHLLDTGLITCSIEMNSETGDPAQKLHFNCPLFEMYVRRELGRPEPDEPPKKEPSKIEKIVNGLTGNKEGITLNIEYHENIVTNNDNSVTNNLNAENIQIVQGMSASELIGILTSTDSLCGISDSRQFFATSLSNQIREALPAEVFSLPAKPSNITEVEFDRLCDEKFDEIGQRIIQDVEVDDDQELINVTTEELQTLDNRFYEAVSRCRNGFDTRLLNIFSERCKFYFKLAVIVEDALNFPGIKLQDYSPQLVLYGKVLEQSLRDNLYPLFHKDKELGEYDTYTNKKSASSPNVFRNKNSEKSFIGDYAHLINAQRQYLSEICSDKNIQSNGQNLDVAQWESWWRGLEDDIHQARKIRNKTDHASPISPDSTDLNNMFDCLAGTPLKEGVLSRLETGLNLFRALYPASVPQSTIDSLINQECTMTVLEKKPDGRIKGILDDNYMPVKISKKKYVDFLSKNPESNIVIRDKLQVRISDFRAQDDEEFFCAEILCHA